MKRRYFLVLLAFWIGPAYTVNKCIESNGRILYQVEPCPSGAHGGDMNLNVNRPFTGGVKQPTLPPMPLLPAESPAEAVEPVKPDIADEAVDKPNSVTQEVNAVSPPKKRKGHLQDSREGEEQPAVHGPPENGYKLNWTQDTGSL